MPSKLHEQFKDEAEFREIFVKPLLNRLGFVRIAHLHGPWELGKDFVFSEMDRFGVFRHYAAQVKHEASITLGAKLEGLWGQIQQALTSPFTLPDSPRECFPSGVYIFNDGEITEQAKLDLLGRLRKSNFSESVAFLDGERLESVNGFGIGHRNEAIRDRLSGLRNQLRININIWRHFLAEIGTKGVDPRRSIVHALEEFLTHPILLDRISYQAVTILWQYASGIDRMRDALNASLISPDMRDSARAGLTNEIPRAIERATALEQQLNLVLAELQDV